MAQTLLTTKLTIPPLHPNTVQRSRLMQMLGEGLTRKLTLVSAPAGFGKTTLVSEWAHQHKTAVAWYSIDEGDDDFSHFISYFLAALQTIQPDIGRDLLENLRPLNQAQFEPALVALINQMATVPNNFTLALDDYHLIQAQPIHDTLIFLLEHLPPQAHLLIATRSDPPLPLARLRARGQLAELRAAQLRFTPEETNQFLHQMFNLNLSSENIVALDARTEGWVAGLRMAALSLQGRDPSQASEFIHSFTGSNRFVLDYLLEEVLNRQPLEIQEFIQQTSILTRLTGPLCDAVTGRQNSQTILEAIDRANLFIDPLDDERRWYRYHRLFADLMKLRLQSNQPAQAAELHLRACEWYIRQTENEENRAYISEAIHHAIQAGATARAITLIEGSIESQLLIGGSNTLMGWLKKLPAEEVKAHPRLCVGMVWSLILSNQIQLAGKWLLIAEQSIENKTIRALSSPVAVNEIEQQILVIRTLLQLFQGEMTRFIELVRQLASIPLPESVFLREVIHWLFSMAGFFIDDIPLPGNLLTNATNPAAENSLVGILSLYTAAFELILKGKLNLAEQMLLQGERSLPPIDQQAEEDLSAKPFPINSLIYQGLGEVYRQRSELQKADAHLTNAIQLLQPWGHPEMLADIYTAISRLRISQGDFEGADQALRNIDAFIEEKKIASFTIQQVIAQQARVWIAQGKLEEAKRWANSLYHQPNQMGKSGNRLMIYLDAIDDTSLVRLLMRLGDFEKAGAILDTSLKVVAESGWQLQVMEMLVLRAIVYKADGEESQAIDTLLQALESAEKEGYRSIFLDEGENLCDLLEGIAHVTDVAPRIQTFCQSLLKDLKRVETPALAGVQPGLARLAYANVIEPLSEREIEVLRLLNTGFSNQEIAEELVVAISTIKTHINHLYSKLGVSNRAQAISRARELGLL